MKYKKDVPKKYQKYVKWIIVDKNPKSRYLHVQTFQYKRWAILVMKQNCERKAWVEPVLCLPLSMVHKHAAHPEQIWVDLT